MDELILIYQDQLSLKNNTLKLYKDSPILMVEALKELSYVCHHKQKIVFWLSAMRHFYQELKDKKRDIKYIKFGAKNSRSITDALKNYKKNNNFNKLILEHPAEYRQKEELENFCKNNKVELVLLDDHKFIADIDDKPDHVMEAFYRKMRAKTGYLISNNKPVGGKWNYDSQNRKAVSKNKKIPEIKGFAPDKITKDVMKLVNKNFANNFGDLDIFWFAITRKDALKALNYFITKFLPEFGDYQDAMLESQPFLYHSTLSQYINIGLLSPIEVCDKVEQAYKNKKISLNTCEGFIRQIIGWREYVRLIYWHNMPEYAAKNYLDYSKKLPKFYWDANTKMNCIKSVVNFTIKFAYSHHIQRLMITGNFAALIGVKPNEIHEWYLAVYADAFEWVEMPNTIGMATFADGGIMATKPYIASGNYVNKMSNFCKNCHYKVAEKEGESACPFNYLYWNYLIKHKEKLIKIQRLNMPYNLLAKMDRKKLAKIKEDSEKFLEKLNKGEKV